MSVHHIICQNCKTENINSDYCSNCGEIINIVLKRKLEQEKQKAKIEQEKIDKGPSKTKILIDKLKNHPNILIRSTFNIVYSIGIVAGFFAAAVGAVIAGLAG